MMSSSDIKIEVIDSSQFIEMLWKNGKGKTTQMLIEPKNATVSDPSFELRVSSAKVVESGPFSSFPNHQRILFLIDGNDSSLKLNHKIKSEQKNKSQEEEYKEISTILNRNDSDGYLFDGDWNTNCELIENKEETKTKTTIELIDLNVFFNKNQYQFLSTGFIHDGKTTNLNLNENSLLLAFAIEKQLKIDIESKEGIHSNRTISKSSLLKLEEAKKVTFTSENGEYLFVILLKSKKINI